MVTLVKRKQWQGLVENAWQERTVIWLAGVRRVGKTCLCRSLEDVEYFDCELPRVRRMMEDPEAFLNSLRGKRIILDEIHRLGNPSELLKIAADHYPDIHVLATGSSTLGASAKFKDKLTGRKRDLMMMPMTLSDLEDFQNEDLGHRFIRGGLPPFFIPDVLPERDFQEWMDSYWAKDIQELFHLERRASFQKFVELMMAQSGGIFEATSFASPCEVSRTTISNYLKVLETTFVVHVLRPFSKHRASEIVAAPKVYAFDTGFVCYYRGWASLRREDMGHMWEHFVINEICARTQMRNISYWRDKRGHEIDLIFSWRGKGPIAVECKWSADDFDPKNLKIFRKRYPKGNNFVVSNDIDRSFVKTYDDIKVDFVSLSTLASKIADIL